MTNLNNIIFENKGLDLTNRMMKYDPWPVYENFQYRKPSPDEIEEIYGGSGEAVCETLLYFEKCGGDSHDLEILLNEHIQNKSFFVNRSVLLYKEMFYTNEFYFYFIMFTKKIIGRFDFHFGESENINLSANHYIYEKGFLKYDPYDTRNNLKDTTNGIIFAFVKYYTPKGYNFDDLMNWAEILVSEKNAVSYKNLIGKNEHYWLSSEFMNYLYCYVKIIINKNNFITIVDDSWSSYGLYNYFFIPQKILIKAFEYLFSQSTNIYKYKFTKKRNTANFEMGISDEFILDKWDKYYYSCCSNGFKIAQSTIQNVIKKLYHLPEKPRITEITGYQTKHFRFILTWDAKTGKQLFINLLSFNSVLFLVYQLKLITLNFYILTFVFLNILIFLYNKFINERHFRKNYEDYLSNIITDYQHKMDDVKRVSDEITIQKTNLFLEKKESERRLKITEVYTKHSLIEIIEMGQNPAAFAPIEDDLAIMFCDIRNFSMISSCLKPLEVVDVLNNYFNMMNELVLDKNGEIDKLIGDCIMAVFSSVESSIESALDIRKNLHIFNQLIGDGKFCSRISRLYNGIGINYGTVIRGNIGSISKLDYTVIGDVVNVANRLETLTKYYDVGIIISDQIKERLTNPHLIRFLDTVIVKGQVEPINIYEVFDSERADVIEKKLQYVWQFEEAYDLYRKGFFKEASAIYNELIMTVGSHKYQEGKCSDPALHFYYNRCLDFHLKKEAGLLKSWDGVYRFTE